MNYKKSVLVMTLVLAVTTLATQTVHAKGRVLGTYEKNYAAGYADGFWKAREPNTYNNPVFAGCHPGDVRVTYYYHKGRVKATERIARTKVGYAKHKFSQRAGYCTISFNKDALETTSPKIVCAAFTHEYGHLLGKHHSTDPVSVMYASFNPENEAFSGKFPCNP